MSRLQDDRARAAFDRHLLQSALDGRHLRPRPLDAQGESAPTTAAVLPAVLDALADAHGVEAWTPASFEREFLREAMGAWHGVEVERRATGLAVRSRVCPVASQAARDERVCQSCRALHVLAAQVAYGRRLRGATFTRLLAQGDDRCELNLATAAED